MGPKATPAKQKNTLFSYFSPGAKPVDNNQSKTEVLSTKRSPNKSPKSKSPVSKQATPAYEVGDLLWCKLEGYPWWPSLVCNHPTQNTHYKGGKNPQIHVQFFDNPVSRAWIKLKNCHVYKGTEDDGFKKGGMFHTNSAPVVKGTEDADKALKMDKQSRLDLIVDLQPSDEEDEMDLDPDIFDNEMSEDDSKENLEAEVDNKSKKSPVKGLRSTRHKAKRRRIVVEDDSEDNHDSEDEFKPDADDNGSDASDVSSGVDEDDVTSDEPSEPDSPIKLPKKRKRAEAPKPTWGPKTARKPTTGSASSKKKSLGAFAKDEEDSEPTPSKVAKSENTSPKVSEATKSKLSAFSAAETVGQTTDSSEDKIVYLHYKYDWLQPDKIRDSAKRLKSDPDYDPRTLYIPDSEKNKFTPAMRQWWNIKCEHFDTVLFFKMGKFYELFHMDATVAVNELGLIYMKGDYAHSGFPEIAYSRYADTLVNRGYKVARIEQTETPDMMNERCKTTGKNSKFDKVVKREVCRITTKGTQTFSFLSGECADSKSTYLLALAEKETDSTGCSVYGVCFVDTSIGKFHIGQFEDDRHCSRLRTVIAHYPPVQILMEKGKLSPRTQSVINNTLTSVMREVLAPKTEFWDSSKTLKVLSEESYFKTEDSCDVEWPDTIKSMLSDSDALGHTAADGYSLAISSLGALTWYLQYCLMDDELLSMKNFTRYDPLDNLPSNDDKPTTTTETPAVYDIGCKHMVLDGVTLTNLDITENCSNDTLDGTLLQRLDQCSTPFGKRLFRQWLCAPLCNPDSINDRLNAIDDLIGCQDVVTEVTDIMKKLPDLERLLSRIHTLGTNRNKKHPDSRAILYEEVTYSKRKIEDFLATLEGFKSISTLILKFKNVVKDFKSKLLQQTLGIDGVQDNGLFPDLKEDLKFFDNAFDHNKAKKDGVIVPSSGVDEDYDTAIKDIKQTQNELQSYLEKQKSRLGCRSMVYWGTAKNRYQMEIPESAVKNVPNEYRLMSSKKGAKRFRTQDIEDMLAQLIDAEDRKDAALKDVMRRIFHNFDKRYKKWDQSVQCISVLDVLISMSQYNKTSDGEICRPEIVLPSKDQQPFIEIRDARHPCVCTTFSGGDFIPNDTVIGIKDELEEVDSSHGNSQVVLVTGPNMGGKSTLMRQVGLVVVMAQMGCYVPASKCKLTPVDRVFTRLGASDRIMAGESTFFVELSETSSILQHASQHSLVLVDELGRGTATYDGTAIACSVVQELSRNIKCRTLFSTHYHSLVEEFSHDPNIRLGHMSCMVENEDEEDPTQETITFLYKFISGACPKSYGFNAARLANLPEEVIKRAIHKAKHFESSVDRMKHFRNIWKNPSRQIVEAIQS